MPAMRTIRSCFLPAFLCSIQLTVHAQPAGLIFTNGNIYTANDRQPQVEAIVIKQGRVIFVGPDAALAAFHGATTRIIDLGGKTVVPGLTDAHCLISTARREGKTR